MKNFKKKLLILTPFAMIATGCSTFTINDAEEQIEQVSKKSAIKLSQATSITATPTTVTVNKGRYVAGKAFKLSDRDELPSFFTTKITFNQKDPVSFNEVLSNVGEDLNTRIELSSDAIEYLRGMTGESDEGQSDSNEDVEVSAAEIVDYSGKGLVGSEIKYSLMHSGTVASLLDVVTARANLFWKWDKGRIEVFRHETKHYIFDGESGTTTFNAKVESSKQAQDEGQFGSAASSHGTTFTTENGSVFDDLRNALESMKSRDGRFSISKQTGTVTVTDTPAVQEKVDEYIEEINGIVNKRILIKTEVYEVVSDEQGNFGIDWNVVYEGSSQLGFDFASALGGATDPTMSLGLLPGNGVLSGTKAFVNALNEVTDYSLLTTSTNYTTNGQPVPVQIANEKHYIKSITSEAQNSATGSSGNTRYQIEPGSILSGFTMTVNPRVDSEGDIAMQFAVDMSQLNSIEERSFGEGDSKSIIQLPDRTSKNFIQRVSVKSGNTIMINGFERTTNESSTKSIGQKETWVAGGNRAGGKKKVMTVILVTPYIMSK
jgi:type IVB pilus formation R64 PilN family outer membrane protein